MSESQDVNRRSTFQPFPRLPQELRNKVWKQALPAPRTIKVRSEFGHNYGTMSQSRPVGLTGLLEACKDSRAIALAKYSKTFEKLAMKVIYFDWKRDTLYLPDEAAVYFWDGESPRKGPKSLQAAVEWQSKIQNLIIGTIFSSVVRDHLGACPNLKTLVVRAEVSTLQMNWWKIGPVPKHPEERKQLKKKLLEQFRISQMYGMKVLKKGVISEELLPFVAWEARQMMGPMVIFYEDPEESMHHGGVNLWRVNVDAQEIPIQSLEALEMQLKNLELGFIGYNDLKDIDWKVVQEIESEMEPRLAIDIESMHLRD